MKLVTNNISKKELETIAEKMFGKLVKAVVDIETEVMAIDADMHADEEQFLLEKGSKQVNLWGINLHPKEKGAKFIEFDSMINLRPRFDNHSRGVDNPIIKEKIIKIVNKLVE